MCASVSVCRTNELEPGNGYKKKKNKNQKIYFNAHSLARTRVYMCSHKYIDAKNKQKNKWKLKCEMKIIKRGRWKTVPSPLLAIPPLYIGATLFLIYESRFADPTLPGGGGKSSFWRFSLPPSPAANPTVLKPPPKCRVARTCFFPDPVAIRAGPGRAENGNGDGGGPPW